MVKTKAKIARRMKSVKNRRNSNKKVKNLKPMKIAALIFSAIQDLRESKGTTPNKITGYISYASNLPESRVKKQVNTALKRGVQYGILRRYRGHYFLPTGDELDRANRIAGRFARLPTPAPSSLKSSLGKSSGRTSEPSGGFDRVTRSRKSLYPLVKKAIVRRSQSLPVSPATSLSEMSWTKDVTPIGSDTE